jgi:hypothetical protein
MTTHHVFHEVSRPHDPSWFLEASNNQHIYDAGNLARNQGKDPTLPGFWGQVYRQEETFYVSRAQLAHVQDYLGRSLNQPQARMLGRFVQGNRRRFDTIKNLDVTNLDQDYYMVQFRFWDALIKTLETMFPKEKLAIRNALEHYFDIEIDESLNKGTGRVSAPAFNG